MSIEIIKDTNLLEVFPCLGGLSQEEWTKAQPFAKRFPAKSKIFQREDAAVYGMFLLSGTARITVIHENGDESVLNRLSAGEICSLLVLSGLSGRDYPGSLIAETDVDALFVLRSRFLHWVQFHEPFRSTVFGGLLEGTLRMIDMMGVKERIPVEKRLARALLRVTTDQEPLVAATHQELADEIGSAREVVSRTLLKFARSGWIETGRGWVKIIQRNKLDHHLCD
ncbi:Crp/Fnr family transcriptional regulator [Paenibacillus sp. USDA918EY]|uniref:Crp/Fnr family transcriptional regulator n=1 Tax=Paenibacillus sp. USDA918EY TaxID=2689575 RepID=UPI0013578DF7|nr:Crp/Fnr family transcriptional regulator [Paenibacillus sp. USDA918EY]